MTRRLAALGCSAAVLLAAAGIAASSPEPANSCDALPPIAHVVAADERSRNADPIAKERELRDFGLFWYRNLASDVVDGRGLSIEVLTESFRPACKDDAQLLAWLRALLLASSSGTDFSRRLALAHAEAIERAESRR
jgi:hypothetical protein